VQAILGMGGLIQNIYKGEPNTSQLPYGELMKYTRFEKARIIGARALQISFGAPVLVDYPADLLDPIDIAMLEFEKDIIPITVNRD
jgi:DNA-directed RNA polymerase subunit K